MTARHRPFVLAAILMVLTFVPALVNAQAAPAGPRPSGQARVDVVLSTFTADNKLVAALPYTLFIETTEPEPVSTGGRSNVRIGSSSLRIGGEIPTGRQSTRTSEGGASSTSPEIISFGTSIDVTVYLPSQATYPIELRLSDRMLYSTETKAKADLPVGALRTYSIQTRLHLASGQKAQFTAATDPLTGETIRGELTFTILK